MCKVHTIGRVIFGLPFVIFGLFHFMAAVQMAALVPPLFPGNGALWVVLAGIVLLAGGLSIITTKYVKYAGGALAALLAIFILTMHLPGMGAEATRQLAMVNLLKDLALLGGVLMVIDAHACRHHDKLGMKKPMGEGGAGGGEAGG